MSDSAKVFIGRQPILDRRERIVAYELLFRDSAESQHAVISEVRVAATRVMADAFSDERHRLSVSIIDFNMPFSAMVGLIVKVTLASVPAALFLMVLFIFFALSLAVFGIAGG